MNKGLVFFLVLACALFTYSFVSSAYAVNVQVITGKNYDEVRTYQGEGYRAVWTSHPDRVWDGDSWENYVWSQTGDYIRFESEAAAFEFYKNTCDFKLYPAGLIGTNLAEIESYSYSVSIAGNPVNIPSCTIQNLISDNEGISFEAKTGPVIVLFNLNYAQDPEWTYDISGSGVITVTEVCTGCTGTLNQNDEFVWIDFGSYILNTKNETHGAFKEVLQNGPDFEIKYEKTSTGNLIIDPTFGYTDKSNSADSLKGTSTGATCGGSESKTDPSITERVSVQDTAQNSNCYRYAIEWDVSSIPDTITTVSDSSIRYDIKSITGTGRDCEWNNMATADISTLGAAALWTDIGDGTTYVSGDTNCQTAADDYTVDLGATHDVDILASIQGGTDEWALGVKYESEARDASDHQSVFNGGEEELRIVYNSGVDIDVEPLTFNVDIVGDMANVTGSWNVTTGAHGTNFTQHRFLVNSSVINTNSTDQNFTNGNYWPVNYGPFWHQMTTDLGFMFEFEITAQNSTTTVTNSTNLNFTREYDPTYANTLVNPGTQGQVNHTITRSSDQDEISMKVNREGVSGGVPWEIECIAQDTTQAITNSTDGTWINETNTGYFNETWTGFADTHAYISCYNDDLLFSTTSYTNSSLAVLGIAAFDDSFGSFLGVPVGVFFIVMAAGAATQRTAPTYIVIVLGIIGVMSTIGFFTLDANTWALALIAGMLGLFVGRKFI